MLGEIFSIGASLLWSLSMVIAAKALRQINPLAANTVKSFFGALFMIPIALVMIEFKDVSKIDIYSLALVIISAIIALGVGDTCLFKSVTLIGVSKSYTIAYTFPLYTMFFATLFLEELFLLKYLIGTIIIFLGIANALIKEGAIKSKSDNSGIFFAFMTASSWSIGSILITIGLRNIDVILANVLRFPFLCAFLLILSRLWKSELNLSSTNLILLAISGILTMSIGGVLFLFGVKSIGISRATSLSATSPVWASLMSNFILKEKITFRKLISAAMVVVGIYFLI